MLYPDTPLAGTPLPATHGPTRRRARAHHVRHEFDAFPEGFRMGVTYRSMVSKAQRQPIIESYIRAALALRGRSARLVMCPHCGAQDQLVGTVEQKGRKTTANVPLTPQGHALSKARYDGSSIRIAKCLACQLDVIPLAYDNPYAFLVDALPPDQMRRYVPDFDSDEL